MEDLTRVALRELVTENQRQFSGIFWIIETLAGDGLRGGGVLEYDGFVLGRSLHLLRIREKLVHNIRIGLAGGGGGEESESNCRERERGREREIVSCRNSMRWL